MRKTLIRVVSYLFFFFLLFSLQAMEGHRDRYFVPVWSGNGYMHMNIYVFSALIDGRVLGGGDEIGVFDNDYCVGAVKLAGPIGSYVSIITSMNDPYTTEIDGYRPGNLIRFRIWDSGNGIEYTEPEIEVEIIQGGAVFAIGGTTVVNLSVGSIISPQDLLIQLNETEIVLTWEAIPEATGYRVYSSTNSTSESYQEDTSGVFNDNSWTAPLPQDKVRFYYVTAFHNENNTREPPDNRGR